MRLDSFRFQVEVEVAVYRIPTLSLLPLTVFTASMWFPTNKNLGDRSESGPTEGATGVVFKQSNRTERRTKYISALRLRLRSHSRRRCRIQQENINEESGVKINFLVTRLY